MIDWNNHIYKLNKIKPIYIGIEAGLVCVISFFLGHLLVKHFYLQYAYVGGFWCTVCAVSVLHPFIKKSLFEAKKRFYANILSIFLTGILCFFCGFGYIQFFFAIALNVLITRLTKFYPGTRIASTQAGIIVVIGMALPNFSLLGILMTRIFETIIGILVGLIAVYISYQLKVRSDSKLDAYVKS